MLENLNAEQQKAVQKTEGAVLVLAGAGSGKTKVLTTRVAYLIKEKHVSPHNILAITFTNKAAKEMKERLSTMIGEDIKHLQVSTFHSFGLRIIRENYKLLGLNRTFTILDSDDSLRLIKRILKDKNYTLNDINPNIVKNKISSAKNEMISPNVFIKHLKTVEDEITSEVYYEYEELLKKNSSVDFDDLLLKPLDLFLKNKEILEKYQEHFKYILIDEYQDTNEVQYQLTKILASKYKNICCVGDNDQSIYSFRGANYRNILNFEKDYRDAEVIKLEQNYRSTKNILAAANSVIKNNKDRKDKNLWSSYEEGDKIIHYDAMDADSESKFVADEIKKLENNGVKLSEIAIIYRTNAQSRSMEERFNLSAIPYKVIGSLSFYSRKEIKDLLAYLNLIYNTENDIALERIINTPKRGIGETSIIKLREEAKDNNKSMYEELKGSKQEAFKDIIEFLRTMVGNVTLTELVDLTLQKSGIYKEYQEENSLDYEMRLENLEEFKTVTKKYEEENGDNSLEEFLYQMALISDTTTSNSGVSLMTFHTVKGLEFPYVFIVGMEEGLFPHKNSIYSQKDIEEERRLCYVAITRAMKKLYITSARSRLLYGQQTSAGISRFVSEISDDLIETISDSKAFNFSKPLKVASNYRDEEEVEFKVGDLVYHENFGKGIVREVNDSIVKVNFSFKFGLKSLSKNHKKLIKYMED